MRVREIPVTQLPSVSGQEWVDRSRRPFVRDGIAYVPVREGYSFSSLLPRRVPYRGRGYTMLGSIAIFHGRMRPEDDDIRALWEWKKPTAILWIPSCEGSRRKPRVEVLIGTPGEVIHRECGIRYLLDPSRVMFSAGNRVEKERLRALVQPGEKVADMFAGIGYFTLPLALAGAHVHAMEIDPLAFQYLQRNIELNRVRAIVSPELGDCRACLFGVYDRIVMGHFDSLRYLGDALAHVHPGSVIHVHTAGDATGEIERVLSARSLCARTVARRVKKLGPHTWHYVQDVTIE